MNAIAATVIAFAATLAGAALGFALHATLPRHHLDGDSKDVVKLVMGLVGTMAALVLGLLIATAKGNYDTQNTYVAQLAADVLLLDRQLAHYGPESGDARAQFRDAVDEGMQRIWPPDEAKSGSLALTKSPGASEGFFDTIQNLVPKTDAQRMDQSRALQLASTLRETRVLMFARQVSAITTPFLVVLLSWLFLLFVGFGLMARINGTVLAALGIGAASVAGAIFLILELETPYTGLIRISSGPVEAVYSQLGH